MAGGADGVAAPPFQFRVTNFSAVCQVLPINYADRAFEVRPYTHAHAPP